MMARHNDNPYSTHYYGPKREDGIFDELDAIAEKLMATGIDEDTAYKIAADRCETKNDVLTDKGMDWD